MERIPDRYAKTEAAYVMINCESGMELAVLEELQSLEGVREIQHTMGNYDIILRIETESIERLRDLIIARIRKTKSVLATTTLMCTESVVPMLMNGIQ